MIKVLRDKMRFIAFFIAICLVVASQVVVPTYAGALSDISSHWAEDQIREVAELGVISGYPDGTFKPNTVVDRDAYIRMVIGGQGVEVREAKAGEYWAVPYLEKALELQLIDEAYFGTLSRANYAVPISREEMASILVRAYKTERPAPDATAIEAASRTLSDFNMVHTRFLDDVITSVALGYINGLPNGTFAPKQSATRAEAAKVILNHLYLTGRAKRSSDKLFAVRDIELGDSEESVVKKLGAPVRKDASIYNLTWYIYHDNYKDYAAIGIADGKVSGLYTASDVLESSKGLKIGQTKQEATKVLGTPVSEIKKGNTRFTKPDEKAFSTYLYEGTYVTAFYDTFNDNRLFAIQILSKEAEFSLKTLYGTPSEGLQTAYEQQAFDLANVYRVANGLKPHLYSTDAEKVAYTHSKDMAVDGYFDHVNPEGLTPAHRFKEAGLSPSFAAENIAAGYITAFEAHAGWVNSEGHRKNLLRPIKYMGVGVYFGGDYSVYYTQNIYE